MKKDPDRISLRIFLSSPGDVADERNLARRLLKEQLPYDPLLRGRVEIDVVSWDDPTAPIPMPAAITPQEAVNRFGPRPSECDIVVIVLWSRLGTLLDLTKFRKANGEGYESGTEWEFDDAVSAQRRPDILIYKRREPPLTVLGAPDYEIKLQQYVQVNKFLGRLQNTDGSYRGGQKSYDTPTNFQEALENDLKYLLRERLTTALPVPAAEVELPWRGSPYPGLRAFTRDEADIFFGRGREVDALIERFREPSLGFLAVVGTSGSGKSSLVRAGLLPRLEQGAIEGSHDWRIVTFMPAATGADPFLAIAVELASSLPPSARKPPVEIAKSLAAAPRRVGEFADAILSDRSPGQTLLLFVDQLEELFTVVSEAYREPFIELLATAADHPKMRVLATLRADFVQRVVQSPVLVRFFQAGTFLVGPPGPAELADIIRKPAARAGVELYGGLADELLRDAGADPGALPLVEFALSELYAQSVARTSQDGQAVPGQRLTLDDYNGMGRLYGAIGQRAQGLMADIRGAVGPEVDDALQGLFRALIYIDATGAATRRRALRSQLQAQSSNPALTENLCERLTAGRLLLAENTGGEPTLTLAHEALLAGWPVLRNWLDQNRVSMQRLQRVLLNLRAPNLEERSFAVKALAGMGPAAGETLTLVLQDDDPGVRASAAEALGGIGSPAAAAVPDLIDALPDIDSEVRSRAAEALGKIGPASENAIPALVQTLSDRESKVRGNAAAALGQIGPSSSVAIPSLVTALADTKSVVRESAARALGRIGPKAAEAAQDLIKALGDPEASVRKSVAEALGRIGPTTGDAAERLILLALADPDSSVREKAAEALAGIGSAAVPTLALAVRHQSSDVRAAAAATLGKIGPAAAEAAPALVNALSDSQANVRSSAAEALGRLGTVAADAAPALYAALADPDFNVRLNAAEAFGKVGPASAAAAPALIENLRYVRSGVRASIATALGGVGSAAREATAPLVEAMADPDPIVRSSCAEALGKIGATTPEAARALAVALKDADFMVRLLAAMALGLVGPAAAEAIPELIAALADAEPLVAHQAANALVTLGPRAAEAVPGLIAALKSDGSRQFVSFSAARALASIGTPAVSALIAALDDEESSVRLAAAQALGKIGPPALPGLIEALGYEGYEARASAAYALAEIGEMALSTLIDALKHSDPKVRAGTARALGAIGPAAAVALSALATALGDVDPSAAREARNAFEKARGTSPTTRTDESSDLGEVLGLQTSGMRVMAEGLPQTRKLATICLELAERAETSRSGAKTPVDTMRSR
jgi:HEAT repeat protein